MSTTEQLLSDFIDAWNAGRRPRVLDYLARIEADDQRHALADQIAAWLEVAPAPEHDEPTRARIRGEPVVGDLLRSAADDAGLWPQLIPRLRERAGLSVREVAQRIVERFGLAVGDTGRAEGYLERLERGALEPSRVSGRLLDALGEVVGASGRALRDAAGYGVGVRVAPAPLYRDVDALLMDDGPDLAAEIGQLSRAALIPAPSDELDRLFTGGPDA